MRPLIILAVLLAAFSFTSNAQTTRTYHCPEGGCSLVNAGMNGGYSWNMSTIVEFQNKDLAAAGPSVCASLTASRHGDDYPDINGSYSYWTTNAIVCSASYGGYAPFYVTVSAVYTDCTLPEVFQSPGSCAEPQPCTEGHSNSGAHPVLNGQVCDANFQCAIFWPINIPIETDDGTVFLGGSNKDGTCPFTATEWAETWDTPDDNDAIDGVGEESSGAVTECGTQSECHAAATASCDLLDQNGQDFGLKDFNYDSASQSATFNCFEWVTDATCSDIPGTTYYAPENACLVDTDGDGVPDFVDPDPNNPEDTNDSDNDGVPDDVDEYPDDPFESEDSDGDGIPNNQDSTPYTNDYDLVVEVINPVDVAPVGQTTEFNDSAIVGAINITNDLVATGNAQLNEIANNTKTTNNLLTGTNTRLESIVDQLANNGSGGDTGGTSGTVKIDETGVADIILGDYDTQSETMIDNALTTLTDTMNTGLEESGGVLIEETDIDYVATVFGNLPADSCENPAIRGVEIRLCDVAPRINEMLFFVVAALTIIGCFNSTLGYLKES
jgi:hypothetical protein